MEVVIVDVVRTPSGRFQGCLAGFTAPELAAICIKALMGRNRIEPDEPDEVIIGNVVQAGVGQSTARQASIEGGLSPNVPAYTLNKVCGSGMKAIINAVQAIRCGDAECIIAGGTESMSKAPYLVHARAGFKFGDQVLVDALIKDGLWCAFENVHMGMLAEYTAEKSKISREEQDFYAYHSHMKAWNATKEGHFKNEIIPVETSQGVIDKDETIRPDTNLDKLSKLKPAFRSTVTAGNAPGLNDAASCALIMSEGAASRKGRDPLARVLSYAIVAVPPRELFYAPVFAIRKLLEKLNVGVDWFDLIELNEAFAAQVLADGRELGWGKFPEGIWEKVNISGGAIALGHPLGASGTRIVGTLVWNLKRLKLKRGLAAICIGGGHAIAIGVEAL